MLSLLALLFMPAPANDCDGWKLVAPLPGVFSANDMATDGTRVVAVGSAEGRVAVSAAGVDWALADTGAGYLDAIEHNGTAFMAVGEAGEAWSSTDGSSWSSSDTGIGGYVRDVIWDGGQWVAVGVSQLATSTDGQTWSTQTLSGSFDLKAVAFNGSQYLVAGGNRTLLTSPDLSTWTAQDTGFGGIATYESVAWDGSQWLLIGPSGTYWTSPDGVNWTSRSGMSFPNDVRWLTDRFVVSSRDGRIEFSDDGINWTQPATSSTAWLNATVEHAGLLVVGGNGSTILTSPDDTNFTARTTVVTPNGLLNATRNPAGTIVGVGGNGTAITSTDGVVWTDHDMGTTHNIFDVTWGAGLFVASEGFASVWTSPDGESWTERTGPFTDGFEGVAYNGTRFVGAGDGLYTSPDGINWTEQSTVYGGGVVWGDGEFVTWGWDASTGNDSVVTVSSDGFTWTEFGPMPWSFLHEMTYADGQYVAVGTNGVVYSSPDARTWSERVSGVTDRLVDVAHDGSRFIAVPQNGDYVLTSPDGAAWSQVLLDPAIVGGVGAWDGGSVLVGGSGLILTDTFAGVCAADSGGLVEGGSTFDLAIQLNRPPTDDVTVTLGEDSQATLSASSLVFTASDWDTSQTVTVTAVDDAVDEGPHTTVISVGLSSNDADYAAAFVSDVVLDIVDNDAAGITLEQSAASTDVAEGGSTDSYTVVLNRAPSDTVTVTASPDPRVQANPSSLVFTTSNWDVAQTVTVTAVEDSIDMDTATVSIVHDAASSDGGYDALAVDSVEVTVTDDDTAELLYAHTGGGTAISESGQTDTVTARLATEPVANVELRVREGSINPGEFLVDGGSLVTLTFTPANWSVDQSVTLSAIDDTDVEGSEVGAVTFSHVTTDPKYQLGVKSLPVQIDDDEGTAGFSVVQSQGVDEVLVERAVVNDRVGYEIWLDTQPTASVELALEVDAQLFAEDSELGGATLTFTPETYGIRQRFEIRAVDDTVSEGAHTGTFTARASTTDPAYDGMIWTRTYDIEDDDVGVVVSPAGLSLAEGGSSETYTLTPSQAPVADVTVSVSADAQLSVSPASVVLPTGSTASVTVTVTAVDDAAVEGDHQGTITHTVTSTETVFDGVATASVTADIADNDQPKDTGDSGDSGDSGDTADTDGSVDSDTGDPVLDDASGCSCQSSPGAAGLLILAIPLFVRRRR